MKYTHIASVFISLFFVGCSGTVSSHLLSVDIDNVTTRETREIQIAVDKVQVPTYMQDTHIAMKDKEGSMGNRNATWAVPTEKALTNMLIRSLQHKFNDPNVKLYPWDVDKEVGIRVKVRVVHFLYEDNMVSLEASYSIGPIKSLSPNMYRYTAEVPSTDDTHMIVEAMNELFTSLINEIGSKI